MYGFLLAVDERSALLQALISTPSCQLPKNCLHLKSRIFLCNYTVFVWKWSSASLFLFLSLSDFFFLEVCAVPLHEMRIVQNWISFRFLGSYSFEDNWSGNWGAALKECCCLFPFETTSYLCSEVFFQSLLLTRDAENTEAAKFSF